MVIIRRLLTEPNVIIILLLGIVNLAIEIYLPTINRQLYLVE